MATGTAPAVLPPPLPTEKSPHERIIRRQLGRTSFHVRLVDLTSSLALLVVGVLVFLLLVAVVDHWIVGLGTTGRTLALVLLAGFSIYYLATQVLPLLVRPINPNYAARTIEEATPSLKNSLINFLLLKQDRVSRGGAGVREVVYEAVEAQAATDIAAVPVEATVDRSRLIRAGYVLCGVMAVFAAYKILSPKDPFQTVARVITPWADIARPSRVEIVDIKPGDAEVYHGQTVTVSAEVHGVREGDPVTLLMTTADGQTVDQPVLMALSSGGLRYECVLPPPANAGAPTADPAPLSGATGGMQQNTTYRLIAGDAESAEYTLNVVAAPTIVVDKLEYQFPAYTKKPPQTLRQQGDMHAVEGTRVTVHAAANQAIKSAWIEFDPGVKDHPPETMQLAVEGQRAWGTVVLQMKADRQTPWHTSYQVHFYNERGQRSQQPILHKIDVIRDLPPEVQILEPQQVRFEVPENGERLIEVRAVDPDFGLSGLWLQGTTTRKQPVKVDLLDPAAGHVPQATVRHPFRPRDHKLIAGDELTFTAVAEDNRLSPQTGKPEPNVARTAVYTIVVTPPAQLQEGQGDANQQPMAGESPMQKPEGTDSKPPMANPEADKPQGTQDQKPETGDKPPRPSEQNTAQRPTEGNEPPMENGAKGEPKGTQAGEQKSGSPQDGQEQSGPPMSGQPENGSPQDGQPQSGQPMPGQPMGGQPMGGQPMGGQSQDSSDGTAGGQSGKGQSGSSQQAGPMGGSNQSSAGEQGNDGANAGGQSGAGGGRQGKAHEGDLIEEIVSKIEQENEQADPRGGQQTGVQRTKSKASSGQESSSDSGQTKGTDSEGTDSQGKPSQEQNTKGGNAKGSDSQAGGASGTKGQPHGSSGKLAPNDQKSGEGGEKGPSDQADQSTKTDDRLPDDKEGQNSSEEKSGGNKGGASQGASKTDKGSQSSQSKGEDKGPGAGKTGDEGAGSPSEEKTGSGEGQDANRDTPKDMAPDASGGQKGEPSPPSGSKQQSDSKGGQSGDQSGGGKKGAGQSAGQEGNDSAGSKSAADEGAGKAGETGGGETGSQAGTQQESAGKTGQSGSKAGEGSSSRAGKGDKGGGESSPRDKSGKSDGTSKAAGSAGGTEVNGGGDGNRPEVEYGPQGEAPPADAANLEYARKATDMALERLRDQEHNPDPELLDRMGWTKEDLAEFLRRWNALEKAAQESPEGKREMDEALRSLGLRDPANRKRSGGTATDNQRDLRDGGNRTSPPPKYRDLFDAFRKGAARSRE